MAVDFTKMHGLGNDFIVIETQIDAAQAMALADRRRGVGCDQVLVIAPARDKGADLFMEIFNPDGSHAGACGNGTRCVADLWMTRHGKTQCRVQTVSGVLECRRADGGMVQVDMGIPRGIHPLPLPGDPLGVDMGNPHCVFFVTDAEAVDLAADGPRIETHPAFPGRTNVEFVQILSPGRLRMRVWERGAGITQACGSGACAAMAAAVTRGFAARKAEIVLDGGSLYLEWRESDLHMLMTGPAAEVFRGRINLPAKA